MDGGPQKEFCPFSRSSLQSEGCWRLLQGTGIHLGPLPLPLLSGDKDIFFFNKWKGALEILELLVSIPFGQADVFIFIYICKIKSLLNWKRCFSPKFNQESCRPFIAILLTSFTLFPVPSLSSAFWFLQMTLWCMQTYISHLCASQGKTCQKKRLKIKSCTMSELRNTHYRLVLWFSKHGKAP